MYDDINPELFRLTNPETKVLEVGCATGRLAEKLRIAKKCYVVGIEFDKEMSNIAKSACDQLIIEDIETLKGLPFPEKFFDVIVFGDVLEHLKNPQNILFLFSKYLSDKGYILVSIPNVAFFYIRLGLLFGNFNYTEHGILDKTHLRFFTFDTSKKLIHNAGYNITSISFYQPVRRTYSFPLNFMAKIYPKLFAIDFIFKAFKA